LVRDDAGVGSLKLIVGQGERVERVLREQVREADVRALAAGVWVAYTEADPADLRDRLTAALGQTANILVVEFERWSLQGDAIDPAWLLRRGH
jgi:hypothetical protein